MKKERITYVYERDCDLSYTKQREGRKSRNPIVALFDWLHRYDGDLPVVPLAVGGINILVCICLVFWFYIDHNYDDFILTIGLGVVVHHLCMLSPLFMWVYRHYRHKYFKKHNLPGPYGWGTLDPSPRFR